MNDATQRQITAASPERSTWLSANAGSGKTRVLTNRVARLLLGGVSPQNILCLTYTKAAASEMQIRLFETLGAWAMLPDPDLSATLNALTGGKKVSPDRLADARKLFAKSVETPGGLRIQTIHSFCAILLRRFPVEAGLSPQFTEMDDRSAELLRDDCLEALATAQPELLSNMSTVLGGADMRPFIATLTGARDAFRVPLDDAALRDLLELPRDLTLDRLLDEVFTPDVSDLLERVSDAMARIGTATDKSHAPQLANAATRSEESLQTLQSLLLFGAGAKAPFGAKVDAYPGKSARGALDPADADALNDLMQRVEDTRASYLALVELRRNLVLQRFASAYLPLYEQAKSDRAWLDFDDLILKARDLLTQGPVAEWVLFRLDGGIDHILVDEAQDTSPAQWQMIEALAREVAAGDGTRAAGERTIFVVGDKKQSIYSFQGADPSGFDRMHDRFAERLGPDSMQRLEMLYSFRSSAAILNAVDTTFAAQELAHIAYHKDLPGRVDLWPLVETVKIADPPSFDDPVDLVSPADAKVQLAQLIATQISGMISAATLPDTQNPGEARPVNAGDVLILFRSRLGGLFDAVIRACKAEGIPMAGADRLTLTSELAVKDIAALLSFLATPEDNLSLAAALKSPLFGWDEQMLFDLAAKRSQSLLWHALRDRRSEFPDTFDILRDLQKQADFLRPYDLIERLLTKHRGRARLVGRLGRECEEAIDAMLSQALAYERTDIPSLTGFLSWLLGDEIEIKRQSEGRGGNLRIMTIHGAKGLEAPIVILPDTMGDAPVIRDQIWPIGDGQRVLSQVKAKLPEPLQTAREAMQIAANSERDRLLYVAMTRAQFWLILCGAGDPDKAEGRWYGRLSEMMTQLEAQPIANPDGAQRYAQADWDGLVVSQKAVVDPPVSEVDLPSWIDTDAARPPQNNTAMSPSALGGAKVLPGEDAPTDKAHDDALIRGSDLHALLEHLRPDDSARWDQMARRLLPDLDEATRLQRLDEARKVLNAPALGPMFARPALVEVPVVAKHPSGRSILGAIDRLIVQPDHVLAIDYKSNRVVPETPSQVPDGLLRQMGAYASALSQIYPGRRIETALLWTHTATLMPLPDELVRRAFAEADDLDGTGGAA